LSSSWFLFSDCDDPEQALSYFYSYLVNYPETYWTPSWQVWREQPVEGTNYNENFVFQINDVVFCGLNLVGGTVHNAAEWESRHQANLEWVNEIYRSFRREATVMVILAHAGPEISSNDNFYEPLFSSIQQDYLDMQIVLIFRSGDDQSSTIEYNYRDIDHLTIISVLASVWPPMQIQIRTNEVFQISINGTDWMTS
jgi:hypothetical protein